MSRGVRILVCAAAVLVFAGLVHYGWTHRWGEETGEVFTEPIVLAMPQLEHAFELKDDDFESDLWESIGPVTVRLLHQVSLAPWGRNLVPTLEVRAFHNGREAYFLLEWKDEVESRSHETGQFPDGVAVGFSMEEEPPKASIMMGFQSLVNIWQWKADMDGEFWQTGGQEESTSNAFYSYEQAAGFPERTEEVTGACQDLLAGRPGTVTRKEKTEVAGRGQWQDGRWRVILKRPLTTGNTEEDVQLGPGGMYVTLAVWDGDKMDRGSRKSISEWVIMELGSVVMSVPEAEEGPGDQEVSAATPGGGWLRFPSLPFVSTAEAAGEGEEEPVGQKEPRLVNVVAKRFEFTPSRITLQKGELVTLRLESLDVTHGLYLDGYGITLKARPGLVGKATFVADRAGRFTFRCSETCGEFHPYMLGFMTVEPNRRWHLFLVVAPGMGLVITLIVFARRKKRGAA